MSLRDNRCNAKRNDDEIPHYHEEDVQDSVRKLKDSIVENDIYTVDEIFRLINEEFDVNCVTDVGGENGK